MDTKPIREEESKKLTKEMLEKYDMEKIKEMVKDNCIYFDHKDKKYRVKMLDSSDKAELDILRRQKFGELLKNKDILFEKEIIKLYKERGINVEEIDDKISKLKLELKDVMYKAGESIEKKDPEEIWKKYKNDKDEIIFEITELSVQKGHLLENSFERTLEHYVIEVMSFLSLEKKIEEKFVRAFKTNEDFLKADEELVGKAISYAMVLNNIC